MAKQGNGGSTGGGGGGFEPELERLAKIGAAAFVAFLALAAIGTAFHRSPPEMWRWITNAPSHAGEAASGTWRAAQGTRCLFNTCPKSESLTALSKLVVAPEANATTYRRAKFGTPWQDVDHNGCDTRDDILRRDLGAVVERKTSSCSIGAPVAGTFTDPYSGVVVTFNKARAIDTQIDHVVSLGEAWRSGAGMWKTPDGKPDSAKLLRYANDPNVLVTTTRQINDSKSDHDAAQSWRECVKHGPTGRCTGWQDDRPTGDRACDYAKRVVQIKTDYGLSVDPAERDALRVLLQGCVS